MPAQYLISNYWSNDSVQQSIAINNMISQFYDLKTNYLSIESWKNWYIKYLSDEYWDIGNRGQPRQRSSNKDGETKQTHSDNDEDNDELAIEVLKYRKTLVDFGESGRTRAPRPSKVSFKVGQVVRHKQLDLVGVIIGWDERAKAPTTWIQRNYVQEEVKNRFLFLLLFFY